MKKLISIIFFVSVIGLLPIILSICGIIDGKFSCDFVAQVIPFTFEVKKLLLSGTPYWSWNSFLGDNFIGANSYYVVGNPFAFICCLLPYELLGGGMILSLILQNVLYGIAAMIYFRRMGFNDQLAQIGALMYALSTFCAIGMFYFIFAPAFILFPLLLVCLEDVIDREKFAILKLSLISGIAIICNFYFAALSFIGAGLYFIVRLSYSSVPRKCRLILKASSGIIIGIMLSAITFIPTIMCSMGSARNVGGSLNIDAFYIVVQALMRMVYILIPRVTEGFSELYNACASHSLYLPFVGCIFTLSYILTHRKNWLSTLLIICVVILLTPLNIIFSLGANQMYVRWGYIFILFAILATLYEIKEKKFSISRVKKIIIVVSIGTMLLLLVLRYVLHCFANENGFSLVFIEFGVFVIANIWLYYILSTKNFTSNLQIGVVSIGTLLMFTYSYLLVNRDADSSIDAILRNTVERRADDKFRSRTDVSGNERNIGYVINHSVPRQFHSIVNKSILDLGACYRHSTSPNMVITHHRKSFDALVSVKDVIVYEGDELPLASSKLIAKKEGYSVYENDNYIPMGYAYDSYMTEDSFKQKLGIIDYENYENNRDVGLGLLQTLVIADEDEQDLKKYLNRKDEIDFSTSLDSVVERRRLNTATDFVGDSKGFNAKINNTTGRPMVYFFSVPKDLGFTAWLDGVNPLKIYRANLGMMAVVIPTGNHMIEFRYFTPGLTLGALVSLVGVIICFILFTVEFRRKEATP